MPCTIKGKPKEITELAIRFYEEQSSTLKEDLLLLIQKTLPYLARMNLAKTLYQGKREDELCADFMASQIDKVIHGFSPARGYSFSTYLQVSFRNFANDWIRIESSFYKPLADKDIHDIDYQIESRDAFSSGDRSSSLELRTFISMLNRLPGEVEHKILSFHHVRIINGSISRPTKQDDNQCVRELTGLSFGEISSRLSENYTQTWFEFDDISSAGCMADMESRLQHKSLQNSIFPDDIQNEQIADLKKLPEKARQWIRDIERLFHKYHASYMRELYDALTSA